MFRINLSFIILQIKNCIFSLYFWLKILLVIIVIFLVTQIGVSSDDDTLVLLYNDGSSVADDIIDSMARTDYVGYDFKICKKLDKLKEYVQKGDAVCGIVFDEDFDLAIRTGKLKNCIKYYQSASSIDGFAIKEVVFPFILEAVSNTLIRNYLSETAPDISPEVLDLITSTNDLLNSQTNISIFHIEDLGLRSPIIKSSLNFSYNIALWLLFGIALIDVYSLGEIYKAHFSGRKKAIHYLYTFEGALISTLISSLIVGLLFFTGDVLLFLLYGLICTIYACLVRFISKSNKRYTTVIPILMIVCLFISPIIYDLTIIIPSLKYISFLVPTTYFTM